LAANGISCHNVMTKVKDEKEQTFEELLENLERNVTSLESGEVPLEEALRLFEEGMKLSKVLRSRLVKAEEKIRKLVKSSDGALELRSLDGKAVEEDSDDDEEYD